MEFPFSLVSEASIKNVILSKVGATFGDSFFLYFSATLLPPDYRCKPIINYTRGREYALSKRAFASRRTHAGILTWAWGTPAMPSICFAFAEKIADGGNKVLTCSCAIPNLLS